MLFFFFFFLFLANRRGGGHRVFEHLHQAEIKKAKDEGIMGATQLETIVHPNEYFKRSYVLKNMGNGGDVKMEG